MHGCGYLRIFLESFPDVSWLLWSNAIRHYRWNTEQHLIYAVYVNLPNSYPPEFFGPICFHDWILLTHFSVNLWLNMFLSPSMLSCCHLFLWIWISRYIDVHHMENCQQICIYRLNYIALCEYIDLVSESTGQPGIRSRFATLTILVPPDPPKIVQGDFLVTTEDREIELECISVGGKPAAEVSKLFFTYLTSIFSFS